MDWYYAENGQNVGPFTKEKFDTLVAGGTIKPETLIWNSGLTNWVPLKDLQTEPETIVVDDETASEQPEADSGDNSRVISQSSVSQSPGAQSSGAQGFESQDEQNRAICTQCGKPALVDEMFNFKDHLVCASCKPVFVQKLKEGVRLFDDYEYAGFWIRFWAKIVDNFIVGFISIAMIMIPGAVIGIAGMADSMSGFFGYMIQLIIPLAYNTFFIGKYAATPGKMALKLKVIKADGEKITYLRAAGRHFSEIISGVIMAIGYIMAAFDKEKRALHDHICSTRVIRL